ncbi:MAG: sigma-E processing peptidase SpoIIGA [Clostridia bacterium]|nr:sigma-E processing peptidase SpoIIGA [Clostridia bacterium]
MEVYVEYVIIDNLIIDFLLLKLSTKTVQVRSSLIRLLLSSVIGTVVAVIMPLFTLNNVLQVMVKLLLSITMCLISAKTDSLKKHIVNFLFFVFYTFLLGGAIIALFYFAGVDYNLYFTLNYNSFMPIGITVLIVYIFYILLTKLIKRALAVKNIYPFFRKCAVVINGKKFFINGYIDSGNLLFENKFNLPIIVASKKLSHKLFESGLKIKNQGTVKFQTAGGNGEMQIFIIDKLIIYNGISVSTVKNVLIGKSSQNFYGGECDLLLHPSLF